MVYAIAELTIFDRARYARYVEGFMDVLARHRGRLLVADESPAIVEGAWAHDKIVVLSFPDAASFQAWFDSEDYRAIAHDRVAAATGAILLARCVDGFDRTPAGSPGARAGGT